MQANIKRSKNEKEKTYDEAVVMPPVLLQPVNLTGNNTN